MADFTWVPELPLPIQRPGPDTLVTIYEDGTPDIRQKSAAERITFEYTYNLSRADMDALLDFFEARYFNTTFTMVSYEAEEADAAEVTVYFAKPGISYERFGPARFRASVRFALAV